MILSTRTGSRVNWPRQAIVASLLSTACIAPTFAAEVVGMSGYELYPGRDSGNVVQGVLFAGTTNAPCNCFTNDDNGGTWVASIDRTAGGGIGGGSVSIVGGKLTVESADVARTFRIQGGNVTWPATLDQSIGNCGPGVAYVAATLAGRRTLTGCLDDTHLDPTAQPFVFPPKIWGTLQ